MNWKELIIHTTSEALEPISNILNDEGAGGVVIEDPIDLLKEKRAKFGELYELDPSKYPKTGIYIKAYFVDNENWPAKKETIHMKVEKLRTYEIDIGSNEMTVHTVQEQDWENEWKKYFKPIKVTNRLMIVPSWETYNQVDENELIITIDPGMAFGTGTHPTTILSLQALEETVQSGDIILDVGTGSGILSIASALLGASHVYAYDLDEVAVSSTVVNRNMNHLEEYITVQQSDLLKGVQQKATIIVSNILADILLHLVDDAWDNLEENGYFITSGIIEAKQQMVIDCLENKGFQIIQTNTLENWVSIIAKK